MLVWIDTETTGLSATKNRLLEIACIITDDALNEIARRSWVTNEAMNITAVEWIGIDQYVRNMHHKNGLWGESIACGLSLSSVDEELEAFIAQHAPPTKNDKGKEIKPPMAGSTISFDRGFVEVRLPETAKRLGYRNVDVSTVLELAMRLWPLAVLPKPEDKDVPHRAMPDIEWSLNSARHYAKALGHTGTIDAAQDLLDAVMDEDIAKLPDEVVAARLAYQHPEAAKV